MLGVVLLTVGGTALFIFYKRQKTRRQAENEMEIDENNFHADMDFQNVDDEDLNGKNVGENNTQITKF